MMKTIDFDTPEEKELYSKIKSVGWALAVIDGETIKDVHLLMSPSVPDNLTVHYTAEILTKVAIQFARDAMDGDVFFGMVSSFQFCDPQPLSRPNEPAMVAKITRTIADAICEERFGAPFVG
jgi:hypothetical protein